MNTRVLVTGPLDEGVVAPLRADAEVVVLPERPADLAPHLADEFDGILCQLVDRIDRRVLEAGAPRLRAVSSISAGLDHVDRGAAVQLGIAVHNTPEELTSATADLAFALLLAVARRVVEADRYVRDGDWRGWAPDLMLGRELEGSTLGIVGFGRIGQAVARRGRGFGMRTVYAARRDAPAELEAALGAERLELDALCAQSDFLSLHVPGTPQTLRMFDRDRLTRCRPGAFLINTARGSVVETDALVDALQHGPLGGAGLDVFENEPAVDPRLLTLPNVVVAPHIGSATHATRRRMAERAVANLRAALAS